MSFFHNDLISPPDSLESGRSSFSGIPIKISVELEGGKKINRYKNLSISQSIFNHHSFELSVPIEELEGKNETFIQNAHQNIVGKKISFSFEPVLNKESFSYSFSGLVTQILLSNLDDLSNLILIKGYSPTVLLEDAVLKRNLLENNLQDVFEIVLTPYPTNILKKDINPNNSQKIKYLVQYNESNFAFLARLASQYQEWFYYNGKELILGNPPEEKDIEFEINGNQNFNFSISLIPPKFKVYGYDYNQDEGFKSSSSDQSGESLGKYGDFAMKESKNLFNEESHFGTYAPVFNQGDVDDEVKNQLSSIESSMVLFNGKGENPNLNIGSIINVSGSRPTSDGRSPRESYGRFRIIEIAHSVNESGNYSNSFKAIPAGLQKPPLNPYVKKPVGQLEMAKVIDLDDPSKMGRVKVEFDWISEDRKSDWIRVGTFYSGTSDRLGMHFIPEIASQVVVAYEFNDPNRPFILTQLYPKKDGMRAVEGNNDQKIIYTRSGNTLEFSDKDRESSIKITNSNNVNTHILLEFKDDGKITIETDGKMEFNAQDTISISSQKDISIKSENNISIEAQQDVKIKGMNVKISGDQEVSIEGNTSAKMKSTQISIQADGTAELKSSGKTSIGGTMVEVSGDAETSIKGGMVMIN